MIEIVGNELYQWDTGRVAKITGIEVEYVHFANKGDSKAVIMGAVDIHAKIPDFLLQTGKQLCVYAVKDGITVESKTFYVKHRERPENYVYEDDQRNYIYELITNAEDTLEMMRWAHENTNLAAENANLAAENANKSVEGANLAAKNANEAADKANHTAKSLMVIGSAEGDSIHLDDAIDQFLVGLRVFGKTTQDGTPTPDAPVDLVSVENPTVTVNEQTLLVPYTLHGIPVDSGGNYTDENGQQWICDEIDFARGVYVKRTIMYPVTGNERTLQGSNTWQRDGMYSFYVTDISHKCANLPTALDVCLSTHANANGWEWAKHNYLNNVGVYEKSVFLSFTNSVLGILDSDTDDMKLAKAKNYLAERHTNGQPVVALYPLATPAETALSEEELAAYATLRTYRGSTTVSNDASAHMAIEYAMDAKKYIDSVISTGIIAATVE